MTTTPQTPSMRTAIDAYLNWHALRGSSVRHQKDVRCMLLAFASRVGLDRGSCEVTRFDCEAFLRTYQERGSKPNTVAAYHRVLDAFFRWLVVEELLEVSPMRRVPKPNVPQEQIKPLLPEELTRLLAQPDRKKFTGLRDATFVAFLADTGLRLSEALNVRFRDLNTRDRSVSVMGKGGKGRTVFYGAAMARQLALYCQKRGPGEADDLLFVNSLGEPLWRFTMTKRVQEHGRAAGITGKRVSPHTLRHTFAVSWLLNGGDAFSLQRLLGHSSPVMTARYVNFATADLARLHRETSPLDRLTEANPATARTRTPRKRMV